MRLRVHQIRAEIDRLEFIVYELDRGPCTEALVERLNDVGAKLCNLSDESYRTSLEPGGSLEVVG
jgi:hypothetical protein